MFLPGPVQDDLLPVRPIDAIRGGSAGKVRLIIGSNRHEGTTFVHPEKTGFPNSWTMVTEMFEKNNNAAALPKVLNFYEPTANDGFSAFKAQEEFSADALPPVDSGFRIEGGDTFIEFATNYAFEMPAIKVALGQKLHSDDVWMYRYELVTASGAATGMRASHAFDLPATFANKDFHFSKFVFDGESEEMVDKLIQSMHGAWVRFAKTGEPDPENWPRFEGLESSIRIFDRECRTEKLNRSKMMEVWGDLRFYER